MALAEHMELWSFNIQTFVSNDKVKSTISTERLAPESPLDILKAIEGKEIHIHSGICK